jgi:hypothetical protein
MNKIFYPDNLKGRGLFRDTGADGRIILKWITRSNF